MFNGSVLLCCRVVHAVYKGTNKEVNMFGELKKILNIEPYILCSFFCNLKMNNMSKHDCDCCLTIQTASLMASYLSHLLPGVCYVVTLPFLYQTSALVMFK